jgi:hypothetical protein
MEYCLRDVWRASIEPFKTWPVPVLLCSSETLRGLSCDWTRVSSVRSRRLIANHAASKIAVTRRNIRRSKLDWFTTFLEGIHCSHFFQVNAGKGSLNRSRPGPSNVLPTQNASSRLIRCWKISAFKAWPLNKLRIDQSLTRKNVYCNGGLRYLWVSSSPRQLLLQPRNLLWG